MSRATRTNVGGSYDRPADAERAAVVLRAGRVAAEVEEVIEIVCPGSVRRTRWLLSVPREDTQRAARLLAGVS